MLVYNPEKLKQGIENDSLFEVLHEALEEGRELYNSYIDPEVLKTTNFYDRAVVDVLIKLGGGKHKSKIW